MKCFILAAGFGKRMGALTKDTPKPLLKVGGYSLLQHSILFAYKLGIREFIINTHYLAEQIHKELNNFPSLKFHVSYEPEILGTAGGIRKAMEGVIHKEETFLVLNPDAISIPNKNFTLPNNFDGDILLYVIPKPKGDNNIGLNLVKNKLYYSTGANPEEYFYMGVSLIKASIIYKAIPNDNQFNDLSFLYRELSASHRLEGRLFEGECYDCGELDKFLSIQNLQVPSEDQKLISALTNASLI